MFRLAERIAVMGVFTVAPPLARLGEAEQAAADRKRAEELATKAAGRSRGQENR